MGLSLPRDCRSVRFEKKKRLCFVGTPEIWLYYIILYNCVNDPIPDGSLRLFHDVLVNNQNIGVCKRDVVKESQLIHNMSSFLLN